jgi:hypothetical protein
MNLLMAPAIVSLIAVGLLVLSVAVGIVLQVSPRSAPTGKSLLWYSTTSLWMAIVVAWLGPFTLALVLSMLLGERGVVLGLWGGGPLGFVVGFLLARRYRTTQRGRRAMPLGWWVLGGAAFVLLGVGLWLAWVSANSGAPPNLRMDFWTWLGHTIGLSER